MKKSFILHLDSIEVLEQLTDEQAGQLFKAIRDYHLGIDPQLDFALNMVFFPFRNQFKRDLEKYEKKCEVNRENGKKGGRNPKPKETEETQTDAKKPDKDKDRDKDNDKEKENVNFDMLLSFFNHTFSKRSKIIPSSVRRKYLNLLREGYTIEDVKSAMTNARKDQYHRETLFKYCTLEFFSRSEKVDKFANPSEQENKKTSYIPTL